MINSAAPYTTSQLWIEDSNVFYIVPRYQRQYAWNKDNWTGLYDDISDGPSAYFLGSIICINKNLDSLKPNELELVDGQQRFVTLAIFYCAFYSFYKRFLNFFDDTEKRKYEGIVGRLITQNKPIINPSHQNNNDDDYEALLEELGIINGGKQQTNQKYKKRKIYKAYEYFLKRLEKDFYKNDKIIKEELICLFQKLNNVTMVKIEVQSSVNAYMFFESLNNRGLPLTVMDLLKNLVYANIDALSGSETTDFAEWEKVIENIGKENAKQERFFRSAYNAFKNEGVFSKLEGEKEPEAKKSNLISIYSKVITNDAQGFLKEIKGLSEHYKNIIEPEESELDVKNELINLDRVSGAPSYSLIMYLLEKQNDLGISTKQLKNILSAIVTFFVWRHTTDKPGLKELVKLFINIIEEIKNKKLTSVELEKHIVENLRIINASEEDFKKALQGPMYDENRDLTRYLLFSVEMANQTKEGVNVWEKIDNKGNKKDKWSIEHILPQGSLNDDWVRMLSGGKDTDKKRAEDIRLEVLHTLGNLTITAYNANLSNSSFETKKNKINNGLNIGYNNGLYLNNNVIDKSVWSENEINKRTDWLIDEIMRLFKL